MNSLELSDWAYEKLGLVFSINDMTAGEMLSALAAFSLKP